MLLSDKQRSFCNEYLIDFNAAKAAIRAKYSPKTAARMGSENLSKPLIKQYITELQQERSMRTQITQDRVLIEIARLALSDPRKAFAENGDLLPVQQWSDDVAAAISSIKITATTGHDGEAVSVKEVKFWDKNAAADKLCKFMGLYETDNRQKSPFDDLSRDTLKLIKERLSVR